MLQKYKNKTTTYNNLFQIEEISVSLRHTDSTKALETMT